MRKELAEHEGVVGLGVVSWEADVLVHVEGDDMLEAGTLRHRCCREIRWRTDERFPSLTNSMSFLYVGIGDEPVGRPRTNGLLAVGAKSFMLQRT